MPTVPAKYAQDLTVDERIGPRVRELLLHQTKEIERLQGLLEVAQEALEKVAAVGRQAWMVNPPRYMGPELAEEALAKIKGEG